MLTVQGRLPWHWGRQNTKAVFGNIKLDLNSGDERQPNPKLEIQLRCEEEPLINAQSKHAIDFRKVSCAFQT